MKLSATLAQTVHTFYVDDEENDVPTYTVNLTMDDQTGYHSFEAFDGDGNEITDDELIDALEVAIDEVLNDNQ